MLVLLALSAASAFPLSPRASTHNPRMSVGVAERPPVLSPPSPLSSPSAAQPPLQLSDPTFWKRMIAPATACSTMPAEARENLSASMVNEGYARIGITEWSAKPDSVGLRQVGELAALVDELAALGLPPQFILVSETAWAVAEAVTKAIAPSLGSPVNIHDFYVFNVGPNQTSKAGWAIHRDRAGADTKDGFSDSGMPKYITVWLALTEARLDTSCMYVLPRHADPDYSSADAPVATAKAGEEVDVGTIVAYGHQHIRALPASPGDALFWSHRLIHWGSAPPMGMTNARRTLTWALADPSFEQPLLAHSPREGEAPPLGARLALVAFTLLAYHHQAPVKGELLENLLRLLLEKDATGRQGAEHLADAALSPSDPRGIGNVFQRNLVSLFVEAQSLIGLGRRSPQGAHGTRVMRYTEEMARYILHERRLPARAHRLENMAA